MFRLPPAPFLGRLAALAILIVLQAVLHTAAVAAPEAKCAFAEQKDAKVMVGPRSALGSLKEQTATVSLGDVVVFKGLDGKLKSECRRKLALYVNDQRFADARRISEFPLIFSLERTAESGPLWRSLLGRPRIEVTRPISLGVRGPEGEPVAERREINLQVLPAWSMLAWLGIYAVMIGIFFWCVFNTSILRDGALRISNAQQGETATFSLAKFQGAVWFFIILGSYLFIGFMHSDFTSTINGTAVVLLGIAGGTVLGSAVVDASKKKDAPAEQKRAAEHKTERATIERQIVQRQAVAPQANTNAPVGAPDEEQQLSEIESKEKKLKGVSEGFLADILSDANGISFHRFQVAVWTVVLGVVFIWEVYDKLAMPSFDATLVGLLGLSAGTYLGLKIPEATIPK